MPEFDTASLYEKRHSQRVEQSFGISLGQIVDVFPAERMCSVVTTHGYGSMLDNFLPRVQWLSLDANPEGDETGSVPRRKSYCLVFTVDGESFVWGFFKPLNERGSAASGNEYAKLIEGDKIMSTAAGNRLVMKSNGSIELYGKETLRRVMFPSGSLLRDICRRYELKSDGGYIEWGADEETGAAYFREEFRKDLARSFIIVEEKGNVTDTVIYRQTIGIPEPGDRDVAVKMFETEYDLSDGIKGKVQTGAPGVTGVEWELKPSGSWSIKSGPDETFTLSVTEAGELQIKNKVFSAIISAKGDVTLENAAASISVSASGEVKIDTGEKVTLSSQSLDIMTLGPVNVDAKGPVELKSVGIIKLAGMGQEATDFVLTSPTTIDPFTGAPFATFSKSIMASK